MSDLNTSYLDLYRDLYDEALTTARSIEDPKGRAGLIGRVATTTHPREAALPLWFEAAEAARGIDDINDRAQTLTTMLCGARSAK